MKPIEIEVGDRSVGRSPGRANLLNKSSPESICGASGRRRRRDFSVRNCTAAHNTIVLAEAKHYILSR